ncbi:hypothetical protein D3C78_20890 [compost metagenome]
MKKWNQKISRSGKDYLPSYGPFLALIYKFGVIETSQVQQGLDYKLRRTVQNYLNALKHLGYITNFRVASKHYWLLTETGLEKVNKGATRGTLFVTNDLVKSARMTDLLLSLVEKQYVTDCASKIEWANVTFNLNGNVWETELSNRTDIHPSTQPLLLIHGDSHEEAWAQSRKYVNKNSVVLVTTEALLREHGPFTQIWAYNQINDRFISLDELPSTKEATQQPSIGTGEWRDAIRKGSIIW